MTREADLQTFAELVEWLEDQFRSIRQQQVESNVQIDQLRRQFMSMGELVTEAERRTREVEPRLSPLKGVPDKLRNIEEDAEHVRHSVESNRAEADNAARILRAEVEYSRQEQGELVRRFNHAIDQLGLIAADVAQSQAQVSQVNETMQTMLERQREVEARTEQFGLRLERSLEVNRDMEERLREDWRTYEDDRMQLVFERLQVVGEMVKRADETMEEVAREQTLRETVLQEIGVWRDQHNRIDQRINVLEEAAGGVQAELDKLEGAVTLLDGRHAGLGERVAGIRRDIAEVVDHVRAEFLKYNQLMEKQRRKQIQTLEQELREMKFHSFRPPEEP